MAAEAPGSLAVGVDVGGTHILAVLMDASGHVYARHNEPLDAALRGDRHAIGQRIAAAIAAVWRHAQQELPHRLPLRGVGIAVPGNVEPRGALARYLPNFGWLEPVDLGALVLQQPVSASASASASSPLGELLSLTTVHLRNDGRCAALAERHFGAGAAAGHEVIAMATLGTGIGGALLHGARGALFDGCSYDAGDFGHHVLRSGERAFACVCGRRGCFEAHASAQGLVRHWRAAGGDEAISLDDAKAVVLRLRQGEPLARAAFDAYRADLAAGLANLVTFYNPSLVVLGGGLARTAELYDGLQAAVDAETLPATRGKCAVVQSQLGADCAAMGAAWLVFAETEGEARAAAPAHAAAGAIVCLGLACMDSTLWTAAFPEADSKNVAQRSLTCGGGNAANSAVAAARLCGGGGGAVRLVSKVGADVHGEAVVAELAREGVCTAGVRVAPRGHATPTSVILVSGAERTIVHAAGLAASAPLRADELPPRWLEGAALLHLDGRHADAALAGARLAVQRGVRVLLDVERPRPRLAELLALADFVVSSADFPRKLAAEEAAGGGGAPLSAEEGAAFVLGRCERAAWVCVTLGEEGCVALERTEGGGTRCTRVAAAPLQTEGGVRDSTGAGDAFIGAAAVGLSRGLPLAEVLRLGAHVAAANCSADGARGGMPHLHELPAELRALLAG
ncbi:hypothetical protein AB1Y20_010671 [Prymnesium parvum]|uniref:Carbohydrate kinase PfkB domain-containing protein n=1 Tax=Prymnesium parvum TaxID=97485 RepID=A0AB34IQC9_PRYPA